MSGLQEQEIVVARVPRLALRPKEAAQALGIGQRLLWEKTNCGEIPHMRIGRVLLYPVASLEEWLHAQTTGNQQP